MLLAPDPTADPCDAIAGASGEYCKDQKGGGSTGGGTDALDQLDPLAGLAKEVGKAAAWVARELGEIVGKREAVDFTNHSFLQQYAVVFAASTVLVVVLWLLAVSKRAVRGVPLTRALGEAGGLLWIGVASVAFTPLILYTVVSAVAAVTRAIAGALSKDPGSVFEALARDLEQGTIGGGPLMLVIVGIVTILLCGALYLLFVLRAVALYAGALLGVVVQSGIVDKDLWGHVRKWASFMAMVALVEPIMVIVIGLSYALQSDGDGPVMTGLVVSILALGAAVYMMFKIPGFGDAIQVGRKVARLSSGAAGSLVPGGGGAASAGVMRGIETHGARGENAPRSRSSRPKPANPASGGISADSKRAPKKRND